MAFTVVHPMHSQTLWIHPEVSAVIHNGSIIGRNTDGLTPGVSVMPVAAGNNNVTNEDAPLGVVVGNNSSAANKVYDSSGEYITAGAEAGAHDNTTMYEGVEGPQGRGVSFEMVEYIPITAETVLRGPIRQGAIGTALTVATATNTGTNGANVTTGTAGCTSVANLATMYWRTGPNAGQYRVVETGHATVHTWTPALPRDGEVGDTVVLANLPYYGTGRAYIDSLGVYIDGSQALTSNWLLINVIRLDLSVAGDEYVEFRFDPSNFNIIERAVAT